MCDICEHSIADRIQVLLSLSQPDNGQLCLYTADYRGQICKLFSYWIYLVPMGVQPDIKVHDLAGLDPIFLFCNGCAALLFYSALFLSSQKMGKDPIVRVSFYKSHFHLLQQFYNVGHALYYSELIVGLSSDLDHSQPQTLYDIQPCYTVVFGFYRPLQRAVLSGRCIVHF